MIDELVALIETWTPGYASKLVGAAPDLLDRIENKLGVALVPEHREFLARMGEDHQGINAYGDDSVDIRAPALLRFLEDDVGFDARALQIAGVSQDLSVPLLMFDRRNASAGGATADGAGSPLVRVGFGDGETPAITPEHTSLAAMLFAFAFLRKCLPLHAWELRLESPGTKRPQFPDCPPGRWLPYFARIVAALGFVPIANTGPWCVCAQRTGDRTGAAVMMYECPGFAPDVRVAAHERLELARVAEVLTDNLELRTKPGSLRRPP